MFGDKATPDTMESRSQEPAPAAKPKKGGLGSFMRGEKVPLGNNNARFIKPANDNPNPLAFTSESLEQKPEDDQVPSSDDELEIFRTLKEKGPISLDEFKNRHFKAILGSMMFQHDADHPIRLKLDALEQKHPDFFDHVSKQAELALRSQIDQRRNSGSQAVDPMVGPEHPDHADHNLSLGEQGGEGNDEQFNNLLEEHRPYALTFAKQLTRGDSNAADDIAQHAMMTALKNRSKYDPSRPFKQWIGTIVNNSAISMNRSKKASKRGGMHTIASLDQPLSDDGSVGIQDLISGDLRRPAGELQVSHDMVDALREAIRKLPEKQREAINAIQQKGSSADAAKSLNLSQRQIQKHQANAIEMLRKLLPKDNYALTALIRRYVENRDRDYYAMCFRAYRYTVFGEKDRYEQEGMSSTLREPESNFATKMFNGTSIASRPDKLSPTHELHLQQIYRNPNTRDAALKMHQIGTSLTNEWKSAQERHQRMGNDQDTPYHHVDWGKVKSHMNTLNDMHREGLKKGYSVANIANYNGTVPQWLVPKLASGRKFMDPSMLGGLWDEKFYNEKVPRSPRAAWGDKLQSQLNDTHQAYPTVQAARDAARRHGLASPGTKFDVVQHPEGHWYVGHWGKPQAAGSAQINPPPASSPAKQAAPNGQQQDVNWLKSRDLAAVNGQIPRPYGFERDHPQTSAPDAFVKAYEDRRDSLPDIPDPKDPGYGQILQQHLAHEREFQNRMKSGQFDLSKPPIASPSSNLAQITPPPTNQLQARPPQKPAGLVPQPVAQTRPAMQSPARISNPLLQRPIDSPSSAGGGMQKQTALQAPEPRPQALDHPQLKALREQESHWADMVRRNLEQANRLKQTDPELAKRAQQAAKHASQSLQGVHAKIGKMALGGSIPFAPAAATAPPTTLPGMDNQSATRGASDLAPPGIERPTQDGTGPKQLEPHEQVPLVSKDDIGENWDKMHAGLFDELVARKVAAGMKGIEGREYGVREHSPGKFQMVSRPMQPRGTRQIDTPEQKAGTSSAAAEPLQLRASGPAPKESAISDQPSRKSEQMSSDDFNLRLAIRKNLSEDERKQLSLDDISAIADYAKSAYGDESMQADRHNALINRLSGGGSVEAAVSEAEKQARFAAGQSLKKTIDFIKLNPELSDSQRDAAIAQAKKQVEDDIQEKVKKAKKSASARSNFGYARARDIARGDYDEDSAQKKNAGFANFDVRADNLVDEFPEFLHSREEAAAKAFAHLAKGRVKVPDLHNHDDLIRKAIDHVSRGISKRDQGVDDKEPPVRPEDVEGLEQAPFSAVFNSVIERYSQRASRRAAQEMSELLIQKFCKKAS